MTSSTTRAFMAKKQSTSFAQVATNLLNVLHGSRKNLRLLLVMFLTLTVSANAWGAEVTFDLTQASYNSSSQTEVVWTSTPVTMKIEKGSSSTNANNYLGGTNSNTRCYSGQVFSVSVSSGYELKTIVITSTSSSYIMPTSGWSNATATSDGSVVTVTANSGATVISVNPGSTKRLTKVEITYESSTPAVPYTVTLDAGSGTCAASVTEASAGDGVTLPTPTLDGCDEWSFAGWKTTSAVTTETTTEPTLIPAGAYSPTSDITLYAVYQRTETTSGGGGGSTEVTFNFGYTDWGKDASFSGTTYSTVEQNDNGVSVTYTRNDGSLYANTTSLRLYKTNTLTFDAGSNTITSITFTGNIGQSDITTDAGTCTNSTNTLSWAGSSKSVTFTRPSNASSYATLTSATLTIGGGSTTYYHSTPDCGTTETSRCVTPKMRG